MIIINALKIVFLLGFLIFIHEFGHFIVAKWSNVKVNQFSIGFGPRIFEKQGKETKYFVRLIPLGGFVQLEGEEEYSDNEHSFNKAPIWKRVLIVAAGGLVNIFFAIILCFILVIIVRRDILEALQFVGEFIGSIFYSLKMLFTGGISINQFMGPVGISDVIVKTSGVIDFLYMLAIISLSLGFTNLLPFVPLDGGKIVLLLIEGIRKKPLNQKFEINLQLVGFAILIGLSLFVTYNDIIKIF